MKLKKIETQTEYEAALKTIVVLIEAYEDENFPIGLPDPIAAIEFRMD